MKGITEEKALTHFRVLLCVWVLIANTIFHYAKIEIGWIVFISNALLFTFPGDMKKKFFSTVCGALTGLVLSAGMILVMVLLEPVIGEFLSFVIPLGAVLYVIIVLQTKAPLFLNTASFVYLTCSCINAEAYMQHLSRYFLVFLLGCVVFNAGTLLLLRYCFRNVAPTKE